ncbi:MAG: hypothetical protein FWD26_00760 [Treponema sp.]|nr:hypothetical protein [Treponema sp.]
MRNLVKIGLCLSLLFIFAACDMPMGLGDPVDTTPPHIVIIAPHDNQWIDLNRGDSLFLYGTWWDDFGPVSITISELNNGFTFNQHTGLKELTVNQNGTWSARIEIDAEEVGYQDYRIQVLVKDSFNNQGQDIVNIRLALLDPLIQSVSIKRYLDSGLGEPLAGLQSRAFYEERINFGIAGYQKIKWTDEVGIGVDYFQNEAFTLAVHFTGSFEGVAGSRMWVVEEVLDENTGLMITRRITTDIDGLAPSRQVNSEGYEDKYRPEWDINALQMENWRSSLSSGPHHIGFEIWAWNDANWGEYGPINDAAYQSQIKFGTVWYPASDRPHINVMDFPDIASGIIAVEPMGNLRIEFYDDDELCEIYAGLILKESFDALRGSESEAAYIESLIVNADRRNQIISMMALSNLYDPLLSGPDRRRQIINLNAGTVGEYRLIAMVMDVKGGWETHYGGEQGESLWNVHPPLQVHVRSANSPIIIVNNPASENTFPALNGTKFNLAGYTIDAQVVQWVQIAWVPNSISDFVAAAETALRAVGTVLPPGQRITQDEIVIWKVPVSEGETIILNNTEYIRNNFSLELDILDDFPGESRNSKRFVIQARNVGGTDSFKSFRLAGYNTQPTLTLFYPYQEMLIHDTNADLILHMSASAAHGIGIKQESLKITDVTGYPNNNPDYGSIEDPNPVLNEKKYIVPREFVNAYFTQGSQRTYRFEAEDILGNRIEMQRNIIMSNVPALLYITTSTGPGLYKEGDELRFEAVFSMPVKVSRASGAQFPRLKLYFSNPGDLEPAPSAYAEYMEGFTGNTLIFTYTVQSGDSSSKLHTSLNPIYLPPGVALETMENVSGGDNVNAIISFFNHDNSLQSRAAMELDGVRPRIDRVTFAQTGIGGYSYFNNGKIITMRLRATERVQVSGSPRAYISFGSTTVYADFSSVRHDGNISILEFTWLVNAANVPETQLSWAAGWLTTSSGTALTLATEDTITDMAGNLIDISTLPAVNERNGNTANERAFIITAQPPAPGYTLHATNTGNPAAIAGSPILANTARYIRVTSTVTGAQIYYSLRGGIEPVNLAVNAFGTLADSDNANRDKSTYIPSEYAVTAWQIDRAGNTSAFAAERSVVINSRAPELYSISSALSDGWHPAGASATFRLHFSRPVRANAIHTTGAPVRLTLMGTTGGNVSEMLITMTTNINNTLNTVFSFTGNIPSGIRMSDIKVTRIELSNVVDEYGNALPIWEDRANETVTQRPITTASAFNLNRPNLHIVSVRPGIVNYTPARPGAASLGNGGTMTAAMNNTITLEFDREVWAQAGGLITVRPWGTWALPPILSTGELDSLLNSTFPAMNTSLPDISGLTPAARITEYQRRLMWVRSDGLPAAQYNANGSHYNYNYYISNTNGVVDINGRVRPDTSGKWVLGFRYDLYGDATEQRLRDVFNAAKWKWQEIPSSSGAVTINTANRRLVTIRLDTLEAGRIWEVIINEGAFRDAAGNVNDPIASTNTAGEGYRFWSEGTAKPVIRADKHSHGDHYHGNEFRGNQVTRPVIDARIRIDSETPGANIHYSTIRTSYTPAVGAEVFTSADDTGAGFFGHPSVLAGNAGGNAVTGNANNTIGNGGNQNPPPSNGGFFTGLLVPIRNQTTNADIPIAQNGTISWSDLIALTPQGAGGQSYRVVNAGTGAPGNGGNAAVFTGTRTFEYFFYAGDAFGTVSNTVADDTDARLYTGRRDYIAAIAEKAQVNDGASAGGALTASAAAYEGVYKTTLLYRNLGGYSNRFLIQGFDQPVVPSTPGFPLRLTYVDTPPAPFNGPEFTYYTKQAYRQGGSLPNGGNTAGANAAGRTNNNYIWVTWDIVTDWYQTGKGVGTQFNFMQRNNYNYNAVLATYGAVTYRYMQNYTGGENPAGTTQ